jgi:GNAT superfamily N-acetyltransferase
LSGIVLSKGYIFRFEEFQPGQEREIYDLIKRVYDEFVAPDYTNEGNQFFYDFIRPEMMLERYSNKIDTIFTAKTNSQIIGVITLRNPDHISLLFVDKEFHGMGIARKLFNSVEEILIKDNVREITVHASPYSLKIYERLGFEAESGMQEVNGIKYIPMKKKV